jgi:hypothetical protein
VLIPSHLRRLLVLHQPKMEMLLPRLLHPPLVLDVLYLLVQLLSVDLSHVLHHHCHVLRVERTLKIERGVLRIWGCIRCFRK